MWLKMYLKDKEMLVSTHKAEVISEQLIDPEC